MKVLHTRITTAIVHIRIHARARARAHTHTHTHTHTHYTCSHARALRRPRLDMTGPLQVEGAVTLWPAVLMTCPGDSVRVSLSEATPRGDFSLAGADGGEGWARGDAAGEEGG